MTMWCSCPLLLEICKLPRVLFLSLAWCQVWLCTRTSVSVSSRRFVAQRMISIWFSCFSRASSLTCRANIRESTFWWWASLRPPFMRVSVMGILSSSGQTNGFDGQPIAALAWSLWMWCRGACESILDQRSSLCLNCLSTIYHNSWRVEIFVQSITLISNLEDQVIWCCTSDSSYPAPSRFGTTWPSASCLYGWLFRNIAGQWIAWSGMAWTVIHVAPCMCKSWRWSIISFSPACLPCRCGAKSSPWLAFPCPPLAGTASSRSGGCLPEDATAWIWFTSAPGFLVTVEGAKSSCFR